MKTRHTLNVNAAMHGDTRKLIHVLEHWQPPAVVAMGALNAGDPSNVVVRLRDVMHQWGGIVVYRHYERIESELWKHRSVDDDINMRLSWNAPWAWHYVGNEPDADGPDELKRMSDWYADYARKAPQRGLHVVLPGGFATASIEPEEQPYLESMMHSIGEQRNQRANGWNVVGFGSHEYAHVDPRFFVPGEDLRKMKDKAQMQGPYKTRADIFALPTSQYYVILRTERYLEQMARLCGVPRSEFSIDVHDTECVVERLPHVERGFPDVAAFIDGKEGGKTYGLPTVGNYWRWAFDKDPDDVMTDICVYMEQIYPDDYRYFAHYSYTTHNAEPNYWHDHYSVIEAERWQAALPDAVAKARIPVSNPPVTPVTVEKPIDCGHPTRSEVQTTSKINVRSAPTTEGSAIRGAAVQGDLVDWYPDTEVEGNGFKWVYVELAKLTDEGNPLHGWMAAVWKSGLWADQFKPTEIVPPGTNPTPSPDPVETPPPPTPAPDPGPSPTPPPTPAPDPEPEPDDDDGGLLPSPALYIPFSRDEIQQLASLYTKIAGLNTELALSAIKATAIFNAALERMNVEPAKTNGVPAL